MKHKLFALAAMVWVLPAAMAADTILPLQVKLTATKVVAQAKGGEHLLAADGVRLGDVVEYQAVYQNRSSGTLRHVLATLPIPAGGLEYLPNAARPLAVQASLDGKRFDPVPLQRKVTLANGTQELQAVPLAEYRFLRWDLGDIAAGRSATVSSRMRLALVTERQGAKQ